MRRPRQSRRSERPGASTGQFRNLASDPGYAPLIRDYAQKMLSWRLRYADKTLTGYRATPEGLERRA
jgi:hypothetical protein